MMHLRPDDPVWKERALRLAELTGDRWTGRNERGFLQFKSIYFSVDKVTWFTCRKRPGPVVSLMKRLRKTPSMPYCRIHCLWSRTGPLRKAL